MWWFIGAVLAALLGIFYRKTGGSFANRRVCDGEISGIDLENEKISVRYSYSGEIFDVKMLSKDIDLSKLKIGTEVLVTVDLKNPHIPLVLTINADGKNVSMKNSEKAAYIIASVCLVMGIISLF